MKIQKGVAGFYLRPLFLKGADFGFPIFGINISDLLQREKQKKKKYAT